MVDRRVALRLLHFSTAFLGDVCSAQYSALPGFGTASGCSCLLMKKLKHTPDTHTSIYEQKQKQKQGERDKKKRHGSAIANENVPIAGIGDCLFAQMFWLRGD